MKQWIARKIYNAPDWLFEMLPSSVIWFANFHGRRID